MKQIGSYMIKTIVIYIAQVGALWGLLEAYTYFNGNTLKEYLGPYWFFLYILPLFTTAFVVIQEIRKERNGLGNTADEPITPPSSLKLEETQNQTESILTEGHFSPGKVGGNYTIQSEPEKLAPLVSPEKDDEVAEVKNATKKPDKRIHTKGNFSPGEVDGDYKIG